MKNDKVDVRQLCRLLRLGELHRVYHPEDDNRAVFKAAVQQYIDFRNQESTLKHKIKAKFRGWGVQDIEGTHIYNPKKRDKFLGCIKQKAVEHQLSRLYVMLDMALNMQELALEECLRLARAYPEIRTRGRTRMTSIGHRGSLSARGGSAFGGGVDLGGLIAARVDDVLEEMEYWAYRPGPFGPSRLFVPAAGPAALQKSCPTLLSRRPNSLKVCDPVSRTTRRSSLQAFVLFRTTHSACIPRLRPSLSHLRFQRVTTDSGVSRK